MKGSAASFDASLVCPAFGPGEAEPARALLAGPARVPPLSISKFEQDYQPLVAILMGLFMLAGMPVLTWIIGASAITVEFWPLLAALSVAFPTLMYVLARFGRNAPKAVYIDADTGNVQLDGEVVGSLADFYAPRLLEDEWVTIRTAITEERKRMRMIYVERANADPFRLFPTPVAIQLQRRMPQIADHLNALITEYNYRRDVRRWLEGRASEQSPYRIPEAQHER